MELWDKAVEIWVSGGWAMIAIAVNAFFLFAVGLHVKMKLANKGYREDAGRFWQRYHDGRHKHHVPVAGLLEYVLGAENTEDMRHHFDEFRSTEMHPFQRDLQVIGVCVAASPLLGLLGTVTGMLTTFFALSTGAGGDKTMDMVAGGISEALITTETGLIIALAGLLFQYHLNREHERYDAFLAHIETMCTQVLHRKQTQRAAVTV